MTEQTGFAALDLSAAVAAATEVPELKAESADAAISGNLSAGSETKVAQRLLPTLKSTFIHGSRLLWTALLYGAAALAGWLIAEAAWPTVSALPELVRTMATQESAERAAFLRTTQKIEEDIRVLRTEMESMRSSMQATTPAADAVDTLGKRIDAMKTETNSAIGALSGQVEGLRRDAAAKPAPTGAPSEQAGARSPRSEYVILEQSASRRTTVSATVKVGEGLRRPKIRRGDAFQPAKYPEAPGAPRPLGAYGR